jgi:hypothetical protein
MSSTTASELDKLAEYVYTALDKIKQMLISLLLLTNRLHHCMLCTTLLV